MDQLDTQVIAPDIYHVDLMIAVARAAWGYDEQWRFTWEWTHTGDGRQASNSSIECDHLTEKRAHLKLDARLLRDLDQLRREIYHELGHPIVAPIWRSMSDFAAVHLQGTERESYEEAVNSAENVVIDHIVFQLLGVKRG